MPLLDTGDAQRRQLGLVLQSVGLFDLALGAAIAILGPGFIGGGDATIDLVLWIAGAVIALGGLGLWWWGRTATTNAPNNPRRHHDGCTITTDASPNPATTSQNSVKP